MWQYILYLAENAKLNKFYTISSDIYQGHYFTCGTNYEIGKNMPHLT